MTKLEFLDALRKQLEGLTLEDIEKHVEYYKESIEDRMEDGLSEEEAVAAMGNAEDVVAGIMAETPSPVKKQEKPKKKWGAVEIVLLILGFPLWFPLIISVLSVALAVYISLWAAVISLYALPITLGVCALALALLCAVCVIGAHVPFALLTLGACFILTGLCIFSFLLCNLCAKAVVWCTKKIGLCIKGCFVKKEAV